VAKWLPGGVYDTKYLARADPGLGQLMSDTSLAATFSSLCQVRLDACTSQRNVGLGVFSRGKSATNTRLVWDFEESSL